MKVISIFICFCFISLISYSQDNRCVIQHVNSDNGLPQNSIKGIEIDKSEFVWMATEMGLVRYDGKFFKTYNKTSVPAVDITRVLTIAQLPDSTILSEDENGKDYHFVANDIKVIKKSNRLSLMPDTLSTKFTGILLDSCIEKYKKGYIKKWALPDEKSIKRSAINSGVYLNKNYYFFNSERELVKVNSALTNFTKLKIYGDFSVELKRVFYSANNNLGLLKDNGKLYVSFNGNIYLLNDQNSKDAVQSKIFLNVSGINNITCLRNLDKYGTIFIGTIADGLYIFRRKSFKVLQLPDPDSNVFYAQAAFGNNGALTKKAVLFPGSYKKLFPNITSESILKTTKGYYINILNKSGNSGIAELDSSLQIINYIKYPNLLVKCFKQLQNGSIWFSDDKNFMAYLNGNSIHWLQRPKELQKDFIVESFIEAGKDSFWIAGNHGVAIYNPVKNIATFIPGLENVDARSIQKDEHGTIWVCTYGNGFFAWYKNHLVVMPQDKRQDLSTSHFLLNDKSGYCWIPTNKGLFKASLRDMYTFLNGKSSSVYYYYFDNTAGFLINEFNGGCTPPAIMLNNGWLSFSSINGLVQCNPDSVSTPLPSNKIYIDLLTDGSTAVNSPGNNVSIAKNIKHLQFYVASPYFGNEYNQFIEYKIKGYDTSWYPLSDDGIIHFDRTRAGNFVLMLRKTAGFGENNRVTKEFAFKIEPLFTETVLFKILCAATLGLLVFIIVQIRFKMLYKQRKILQQEIKAHTGELKLLVESLEINMKEVELSREKLYQSNLLRERLSMIIVHDLESPLRFLSQLTKKVYSQIKNLSDQHEAIVTAQEVQQTTNNIYRFVHNFGWWMQSMNDNFKITFSNVDLTQLLKDLQGFFREQLSAKGNSLVLPAQKDFYVFTNSQLIKIVVSNILDNANKYTSQGKIIISIVNDNNTASLIITDDGKGISAEKQKQLQCHLSSKVNDSELTGYGFRFIKDFCRILNINAFISAGIKGGTTVTLENLTVNQPEPDSIYKLIKQ